MCRHKPNQICQKYVISRSSMSHIAANDIVVVVVVVVRGRRMTQRRIEVGPFTENFTVRFIALIQFN